MTNMSLSVIIPSLESPLIDEVVRRVQQQTRPPSEIIVVGRDTAGKLDRVEGIRFVDTGQAINPAAARNRGAALATGDILCFIDSDCLASENWLERLAAHHEEGAQIVGGGVALPSKSNYWTMCDNLACFADFIDCTEPGERPYLPSLNLSIRRTIFQEMGGFDERFISGEDTDLSFRLRRQDYTLQFEPQAAATHCPPRSTLKDVWLHARGFGTNYFLLQERYGDIIGLSLRAAVCDTRWQAVLLLPLLALSDMLLFSYSNPSLMRYWYAFPGVMIARAGWYVGLIFHQDRVYEEAEEPPQEERQPDGKD